MRWKILDDAFMNCLQLICNKNVIISSPLFPSLLLEYWYNYVLVPVSYKYFDKQVIKLNSMKCAHVP